MSLAIRTTATQLGMRTTPPVFEIGQPQGELEIKQQKTELVMEREPIEIMIDQSRCFAECGIKKTVEIIADAAEAGRECLFAYTGQIAAEGDRLARIEEQGAGIAEIAREKMERLNDREWNIAFIPQSQPEFAVRGGLKLAWQVLQGFIKFTPRYPKLNYQPGKLDIYVRQYGKVEIRYIDQKV